jgi:hypothetical protein
MMFLAKPRPKLILPLDYVLARTASRAESISGDADAVDSVQCGDRPTGRRNVAGENDW